MTKPTIKLEKLNKKALIIVGIFAALFSLPYLLMGFLPNAALTYQAGYFIGNSVVLFLIGFIVYRLIRGKYLVDEKKFANKVWWGRFLAIILMFFITISPLIRAVNEIPKS